MDYLFLRLGVEEATVSAEQNCGNILAGVGQFAVERGLVPAGGQETDVGIRMLDSGSVAVSTFRTAPAEGVTDAPMWRLASTHLVMVLGAVVLGIRAVRRAR